MIDILLINPPTANSSKRMSASLTSSPPLGLMYIGSHLKHAGYKVKLIDFSVEFFNKDNFENYLFNNSPRIIGITTYFESFGSLYVIIEFIRNRMPHIPIVLGGAAATFKYELFFTSMNIDYIIMGEGEYSFVHLADILLKNSADKLDLVKGLVYKNNNSLRITPYTRISDLNSLYFPDRGLVDLSKYALPFTISTARGCPGNCIFCSSTRFWGTKTCLRSVDNIYDEVLYLKEVYQMKYFFIVDDTFTINPKRTTAFAKKLILNQLDLFWGCESRVDIVTEELLEILYESGCRKIQFGLESADNNILRKIEKNTTKEQVYRAVSIASRIGYNVNVSFIIGHPFDTHETVEDTLDYVFKLREEFNISPYASILVPYPGTDIYQNASKYGLQILSDNFDNYRIDRAIIKTSHLTDNDLRYYYQKFLNKLINN